MKQVNVTPIIHTHMCICVCVTQTNLAAVAVHPRITQLGSVTYLPDQSKVKSGL
jgi:hypothetical protein